MKISMFKKTLWWLFLLITSVLIMTPLLINYEVNQIWGEYTEKVATEPFKQPVKDLAIVNVNILSVDGTHMIEQQTVLIEHGVISEINSQVNLPDAVTVIDGTGKYLIPGLIDSHVHLWQSPNDLLLYLANGVTHIRELNGSAEHLVWKNEIQAGRPGPEMFVASRRHNSAGFFKGWFDRWTAKIQPVSDLDAIESDIIKMKNIGYDAIKIYTFLEKVHFQKINEIAKKYGMQLLGHIPITMELSEIWQSELKELAHTEELIKALNREFNGYNSESAASFLDYVQQRSSDVVSHLLNQDMAVVSTLKLMETFAKQKGDISAELRTVELAYVNPGITESTHPAIRVMGWLPGVNIYRLPNDYPAERIKGNQLYWQTYAKANQILIKAMAEKEVMILAGSDANVPVMVPGFSLHQELQSLTQAGLTEAQALRTATATPAAWMEKHSNTKIKTGKVQLGYQADLLLLRENPLFDIKNTQTIEAVINNGRWHPRKQLDGMLTAVKQANDQSRKLAINYFE